MNARTGVGDQLHTRAVVRRNMGTGGKVAALAVAQVAAYAFPVVFAVVCARNLGPSQYGIVAFYTALTAFLCVLIEFGFDSVGVREVHSDSRRAHPQQVFWNVTLAKLTICVPTCGLTILALLVTRSSDGVSIVFAMVFYMFASLLEPTWYLRSLELMRTVMVVAVVSRLAGIALLVSLVKSPDDVALAMWAYAFMIWMSVIVGWLSMWRRGVLGFPQHEVAYMRELFKSGSAVVLGHLSSYSIMAAGIVVLGAIADPVVTGAANMALRIRGAAAATYMPLSQMGFVRLSALAGNNPAAAVRLGRRLFYVLTACSFVLALLIGIKADAIMALAYGLPEAPAPAGLLLRLVALGLPAHVAYILFGAQALTLFRQERAYVLISMIAAISFFGLLLSLRASNPANYGWALLAAEVWMAVAAGLCLRQTVRRHGQARFS